MSALLAVAPVIEDPAFTAPVIEYADLAPILVVFVAAVHRRPGRGVRAAPGPAAPLQLAVAFGGIVVAFGTVVINASTRVLAAQGSVAVDGPALFLQGTVLVLAFCGLLLFAEREVDPAGDAFAPRATSLPGSAEERELAVKQVTQTEVYPLAMFAVRRHDAVPRGQRPAHHVRRPRGALAAAVPAGRHGPAPPAALAGGRR